MPEIAHIVPHRVEYLMSQFDLTRAGLLAELNKSRKRKLTEGDVFSERIRYSTLKAIDNVFLRGLAFYFNERVLDPKHKPSILFRKAEHRAKMSLADKQMVSAMERRTQLLSIHRLNASWNIPERLSKHKLSDEPLDVASSVRDILAPRPQSDDMAFLAHLVDLLAEQGVLVLEHIGKPGPMLHESTLAGFYIKPIYIVLVRNEHTLQNEIFTLLHELGHYLLDQESIDLRNDRQRQLDMTTMDEEELWCDEFAFSFLVNDVGAWQKLASPLPLGLVQEISNECHISTLAICDHLLRHGKIQLSEFKHVKQSLAENVVHEPSTSSVKAPRAITSKLEKSIYAQAYHHGELEEFDLLNHFKTYDLEEILDAM